MKDTGRHTLIFSLLCGFAALPLYADTFNVDNLNDDGSGSLRAAIEAANGNAGSDVIDFDPGLNGTINLASPLPDVQEDLDINGPGAELVTVDGGMMHRPFTFTSNINASISDLTIANGNAEDDSGGGIVNEGILVLNNCILSDNFAEISGGAIDNVGGNLVLNQSLIFSNSTGEGGFGGGIANDTGGSVDVIESTLQGNSADFSGGAIDNQGTVTFIRSTTSGNNSDFGGAIENSGDLIIRNSTFSGNTGITMGGGLDNFGGSVTIDFSTLTNNSADTGGGIGSDGTVTVKNSLVVNSTNGGNCDIDPGSTLVAQGTNFATDSSCAGFTQSTPGAVNLGALADNGGQTQTHALLAGSVAIDAAIDCTQADGPSPVTQDQRGVARPQGDDCDSGSFEAPAGPSDTFFLDGFEGV